MKPMITECIMNATSQCAESHNVSIQAIIRDMLGDKMPDDEQCRGNNTL